MATVADTNASASMTQTTQVPRLSDSVITVRPTLIVGLGGTGVMAVQWAHHLVKELLGAIPPFVRFLGLDSDAQEEDGPSDLPESDFFNLFRTFHLGEVLRDYERDAKFHKHLSWLGNMKFDAAVIDRGCQGISRLGRLMFVENRDTIRRAVEGRYDSLNGSRLSEQVKSTQPQGQFFLSGAPVVHVAASVCGGTGSGMLIDLAYALREWSRDKFSHAADIIGHLILPEAFNVGIPRIVDKLQAVAYATLRQIELLTEGRRDTLRVNYRHGVELKLEPTSAPFSACYLINGDGPGGSDDRKHLTELVGRMIRAMTIEPASKAIASDLNNKQTDILSQKDQKTRRLLCFSSYGMRYGTAGVPGEKDELELARVRRWLCESLSRRETARRPSDAESESEIKHRFSKDRNGDLSFEQMVERMSTTPASLFEFQPQRGADAAPQLRQTSANYIAALENQFRAEAERACPNPEIWDQLRVRYCAFKATSGGADDANLDTSREYRLLRNWSQMIREQSEKVAAREWSAVLSDYRDLVTKEIQRKAAEKGIPAAEAISRLSQADISETVNSGVSRYLEEFARAVAWPKYRDFLETSARRLDERVSALHRLASFATNEQQRLDSQTSLRTYWESAYATSLFELVHPEVNQEGGEEILADFNKLVFRVRDAFLAGRQDDDTAKQLKRLQEILADHDAQLQHFLAMYKQHQEDNFRKPVEKANPAGHPFYKRVRDVADGALSKISLDRKGRYDETLDMVVAEHSRESCIPQLLQVLGYQNRSALVSRGFEDFTKIWFQFMSFQYGFSLESVDKLSQYRDATQRYCDRAGYTEQDLWLDSRWFHYYQLLMKRCQQDSESHLARGSLVKLSDLGDHFTIRLQIALDRYFQAIEPEFESPGSFPNLKLLLTLRDQFHRCDEGLRSEIERAQRRQDLGDPTMLAELLDVVELREKETRGEAERSAPEFDKKTVLARNELLAMLKNLRDELFPPTGAES